MLGTPAGRDCGSLGWREALLIGLAQALAIVPGVSRSGSTITMGMLLGLSRVQAARFSFLLMAPIIFGAGVWEARHLDSAALSGNGGTIFVVRFFQRAGGGLSLYPPLLALLATRTPLAAGVVPHRAGGTHPLVMLATR